MPIAVNGIQNFIVERIKVNVLPKTFGIPFHRCGRYQSIAKLYPHHLQAACNGTCAAAMHSQYDNQFIVHIHCT